MAAMIRRLFSTRNHNFIMKLFLTFVRPIVEYATPIWNPTELGQCEKIEMVQRRFTLYLFGHERSSYANRLQILIAPTLKVRGDATNIITTYKILHENRYIKPSSVGLITSILPTRSNYANLTVRKGRTNLIKKSYWFSIQH